MKNNLLISLGFVCAFLTIVLACVAMTVNAWVGLCALPVIAFIVYHTFKTVKEMNK